MPGPYVQNYRLRTSQVQEQTLQLVRREVANIIVSPAHTAGDETGRSVGRSLPVHALLVTAACEATGTTCRALGSRRASQGGGIASPVLANLALDGLEDAVRMAVGRTKTAPQPAKAHIVRYADDFVVNGASRELLEKQIKPTVEQFLARRDQQWAPEGRTLIIHISHGFDFLGGRTCANTRTNY